MTNQVRSEGRKAFDEKMEAFEKWYQTYIRTHDVGNPAKCKEFARWAFSAGVKYAATQRQAVSASSASDGNAAASLPAPPLPPAPGKASGKPLTARRRVSDDGTENRKPNQ